MNKYRNESETADLINLNVYSAIMTLNSYGVLSLVQKKKFDVLIPAGGVSLYGRMRKFSEEEKYALFEEAVLGIFHKDEKCLYDISDNEIRSLYREISDEVLNSIPMFNAFLENIEETGRFFFDGLKLVYHEEIHGHEKYFYLGEGYSFFSIIGKEVEFIDVDEHGLDKYPIEGRDFFCQDEDLQSCHIDVLLRDLLFSFKEGGDLSSRYGRGSHRVALRELLGMSDFLVKEENKELIYLIEYIK